MAGGGFEVVALCEAGSCDGGGSTKTRCLPLSHSKILRCNAAVDAGRACGK
jgi:hypothetical protein